MMRQHDEKARTANCSRRRFGTPVWPFATLGWVVAAALLAIPCMAQPPGIVYSTTVPYTGPEGTEGFSIYPNYPGPNVSIVTTDASDNSYIAGAVASSGLPT